ATSPRFLLADEPTGNLDSQMAQSVMSLLEDINRQGTTIIMVTHDHGLAQRAKRQILIKDGRVSELSHGSHDALHIVSPMHADTGAKVAGV
ncbi:MAG: ABC transporter ATP-binding protein, partial [Gammaproteobacteria bacterium]|nr:ABC transporter ATP-binding protein [Gammaproteobacteria bacterium]